MFPIWNCVIIKTLWLWLLAQYVVHSSSSTVTMFWCNSAIVDWFNWQITGSVSCDWRKNVHTNHNMTACSAFIITVYHGFHSRALSLFLFLYILSASIHHYLIFTALKIPRQRCMQVFCVCDCLSICMTRQCHNSFLLLCDVSVIWKNCLKINDDVFREQFVITKTHV